MTNYRCSKLLKKYFFYFIHQIKGQILQECNHHHKNLDEEQKTSYNRHQERKHVIENIYFQIFMSFFELIQSFWSSICRILAVKNKKWLRFPYFFIKLWNIWFVVWWVASYATFYLASFKLSFWAAIYYGEITNFWI